MDTPKPLKDSAHLLDDLESIRQLLGDDSLQPPLLTDSVKGDVQIPLLFDVVGAQTATTVKGQVVKIPFLDAEPVAQVAEFEGNEADIPTLIPEPVAEQAAPNPDLLLHLDNELRAAAQLIMQDVIDDFAPHIETEIKRRLDARMERLLAAASSGKL
ncbi:DNA polymerase III subunit chi [Pseudomonas sp. 10B1]|uniref:DNA polymerase III subunit chi n=1 Tax=unclassified Pseudomonas TaxID=196821 RepID=UPI002B2250BF|nr:MULTISPECIES: DNA polymerase III subunit chi [unclassified Pseudomonas]MEA9996674.1 DNA polymerase III subunit chi [Pseudomonas sp. AA4]MEB0087752.1 DNA polymerase III subunit chi [Pseudomonas sp. RTI1]MEB0124874.1 DNA polymerase III subunit chi [Pseudomonas sp. CCC1.2]MEB0153603.1 DNA polymerase III subunit chi [Pseudomonas sp. CCC4.3]MEB0217753.1 DNA polymerase III subunit chi [Pseudomonas sp. AB12(2023)]